MKAMKQNLRMVSIILLVMMLSLVVYGTYSLVTYGSRWFASGANRFVGQTRPQVNAGSVKDRHGYVLATPDESGVWLFASDPLVRRHVVHAVGDEQGTTGGIQRLFSRNLYAFDDSVLERFNAIVAGERRRGDDFVLTLDASLCRTIGQLFPVNKRGAVVVMNYVTGEILSLQSFPSFDPQNASTDEADRPKEARLNRATRWLSSPGSLFETVTFSAALKKAPDVLSRHFFCNGTFATKIAPIIDGAGISHHQVTLKQALAAPCHVAFAEAAQALDDKDLLLAAKSLAFGENFMFRDLVVENSVLPDLDQTTDQRALAAIGKGGQMATPLHMAMIASAIAHDGRMMEPKLVKSITRPDGQVTLSLTPALYRQALNAGQARQLSEAMAQAVSTGMAQAARQPGLSVRALSASADAEEQGHSNAWFMGFIADDRYPYALCVAIENGGQAEQVVTPLAGDILRALVSIKP